MVGVVRLMRIRPQVAFSGAATAASNAFHGFWLPTPLPAPTFPKRLVHSVAVGENTVSYLRNSGNGAELYLVGTAHVSSKSAQEVKQVINMVKPDIVAVELCEERVRNMMAGEIGLSAVQMLKEFMKFPGGLGENLVNLLVKSFYQIMRSTGLEPGKEFQVAMSEARKLEAELLLMDQDYAETIAKVHRVVSLRDILRLSTEVDDYPAFFDEAFDSGDIEEVVERLKTREAVRQLVKWMEVHFPDFVRVILHERDKLMLEHLRKCKGKVVAIVGIAHMDGIEHSWRVADS